MKAKLISIGNSKGIRIPMAILKQCNRKLGMEIKQYDIYLVNLDPAIGSEIQKTRPCTVISPDEMNKNIQTIIVAPMTTKSHNYPTRPKVTFEKKTGWIVLDQRSEGHTSELQ